MRERRRGSWCSSLWGVLTAVCLLLALVAGCDDDLPPPPRVPTNSPSRALVFRVVGANGETFALGAEGAVAVALTSAGYRVVQGAAPNDVTANVVAEAANGPRKVAGGLLTVYSPNAVRVTITLSGNGVIIDRTETEVSSGRSRIDPRDLAEAVAMLTASPNLYRFAVATFQARAAGAQWAIQAHETARLAQEDADRRARAADEAAWQVVNAPACQAPKAIDACDGVAGYLKVYPAGAHFAEAQVMLGAAQAPIRAIRDEAAWAKIDPAPCMRPKAEGACGEVLAYQHDFPDGLHAGRAAEIMRTASPLLEKLRAERERREEAGGEEHRPAPRPAPAPRSEEPHVCCGDGTRLPDCVTPHAGCCADHGGPRACQ
jgi:hypothetical protein